MVSQCGASVGEQLGRRLGKEQAGRCREKGVLLGLVKSTLQLVFSLPNA